MLVCVSYSCYSVRLFVDFEGNFSPTFRVSMLESKTLNKSVRVSFASKTRAYACVLQIKSAGSSARARPKPQKKKKKR